MRFKRKSIYILLLVLLLSLPAYYQSTGESFYIKGKYIVTVSHGVLTEGIVKIEDGKILEVGQNIEVPEGARLLHVPNGWVLPGLIEAHTTLGTGDRSRQSESDETSSPNTAHMQILDAINPFNKNIKYAAQAGITSVMITPGRSNVIGGQTAVVKFRGKTVREMAVHSPAGVKFSLGEGPKMTYGRKGRLPTTRMGSAYVIRNAFIQAQEYSQKLKVFQEKKKKDTSAVPPPRNMNLEILGNVLRGELTAFIECYRVDDIMTALRIIDEFKFKAVLVGCAEAYKVAEEIAKRKIPVIVSPIGVGPRRIETQNASQENAGLLAKNGIKVVIKSDDALGIGTIRELPLLASLSVRGGLDRELAIRAITLSAAEVLGVDDRIGSLEKGKDADLVIFDGDPFHYKSRVIYVLIDGQTIFSQDLKSEGN
ncbi:amidohydrolase [Acidobacteriota bacterium]